MVKFNVRIADKRIYLKEELIDVLDIKENSEEKTVEVEIIANAKSFLVYNPNSDLDLILQSLKTIESDLQTRIEDNKRKEEKKLENEENKEELELKY